MVKGRPSVCAGARRQGGFLLSNAHDAHDAHDAMHNARDASDALLAYEPQA
jgi:hypothetical protein